MTGGDDVRGAHLLDAVLSVIAEDGFAAVSMRTVAARAGVSLAQVQYYFKSKDDLVRAGFDHAGRLFLATLAAVRAEEPSVERLRAIVTLWLPLDTAREKRARVWLAYSAAAAVSPELAAEAAGLDAELRDWFAAQLRGLVLTGTVRATIDPGATAARLLALIDGVTVQALMLPIERREPLTRTVIDSFLAELGD